MKRIAMLAATSLMVLAGQAQAAATYTPLVVAGGGGGGGFLVAGGNGQAGTDGAAGGGRDAGGGGTAGSGGGAGGGSGGGAGISGDGGSRDVSRGGMSSPSFAGGAGAEVAAGGYGGGGSGGSDLRRGGGGGGGYSGGGGGGADRGGGGGGGGSFLDGSLTPLAGLPALNPGSTGEFDNGANGFVTITYLPSGLTPMSQTFGFTGAVQSYIFADTGLYSIVAAGGQGGNFRSTGGLGAVIGGQGLFTAGSTLDLIVAGGGTGDRRPGGGGGGSFVFLTSVAPPAAAVPEPATWAMMLLGFGGIGFAMRRRSKVRSTIAYA